MSLLVEYDPATGRPTNIMTVFPPDMPDHLRQHGRACVVVPTPDAMSCMVIDGQLVPRPRCPAEVETRAGGITITGLPPETAVQIVIEGETLAVRDAEIVAGRLDIDIDEPGPVGLVITPPWPYLEARHDLVVE